MRPVLRYIPGVLRDATVTSEAIYIQRTRIGHDDDDTLKKAPKPPNAPKSALWLLR